jgi:hypothetical protein
MDIRRELGELLYLKWFNLCLDPFFEEILNLDTKCCNIQNDPGYGEGQVTSSEWDDLYVI